MTPEDRRSEGRRLDRAEGFGERLLGVLLDRAHEMPPQLIAPLIAEEVGRVGGRNVSVLLQDYGQFMLVPLSGRGLAASEPEPIAQSPAGAAFMRATAVEVPQTDGVRVYLPLLDGGGQIGVMIVTLDSVDDDDRRLLHRLAGLVAHLLVIKSDYTDQFFQTRRRQPMALAAEIQWSLLPPLAMSVPQVELAGILEPTYDVAGDSFDFALNDDILHVGLIDAMGHGLDAANMASIAVGAYRHARRADVGLSAVYSFMDEAIADQFGPEGFATAQMMRLNISTGQLTWVNAGHPAPLLIRNHEVAGRLESPTTLPVGFGGEDPHISEQSLQQADRVLCFTDGLIEEHEAGEEPFGEEALIRAVNRIGQEEESVREAVRALSHALRENRGWRTSDDATLLLMEWRGGAADHLATLD